MNRLKKFFVVIATIILISTSASFLKADAKNASYMRLVDKNHQRYEYNGDITFGYPKYDKKRNQTNWEVYWGGMVGFFEKQNTKGYYSCESGSGTVGPALKLPIKKNLTWKVGKEQRKIISTKIKVKTEYKIFKNAVKVQVGKSSEKHYQYFVPNYGMVKETQKGRTGLELKSIAAGYDNVTSK